MVDAANSGEPTGSSSPPIPPSVVAWGVGWFFCLLMAYYLIRPVRETVGTLLGRSELPWLFLATFAVMVAANPVYAALVARVPRKRLVVIVYGFFLACLMGFASVWNRGEGTLWLGRTFFVWVSVFNLFAVSVFWSFLADTFRDDQAKRWFGVIAAGGTLGGIGGSLLAGRLAGWMGMTNLLLLPVPLLIGCVACMFGLHFSALRFRARSGFRGESAAPGLGGRDKDVTQADEPPPEERPTGGSFWEGMWHVVASPYLLAICAMLLAVKVCGTIGYYQQNELIGEAIARPETRLQLFADINLAVQVITIVLQALVAGQVMQRLGLSVALIALPIAYLISFTALAVTATVSVLVAARVAQRSVGFGLFVPAQETLFTVVPRRDKYKAKGFMDTALSRGADVAAGWAYNGLRGLGLTLAQIALLAVPMTLVWALLGWLLGKAFRRRAAMGGGPLD